jgi:ABC-type multidrug transport system ATPase subunit
MPDTSSGLTVREVHKSWPGTGSVLDGIELACPPGGLTLITGRNGAGKTTLLRIIAGLIAADAGDVRHRGLGPETEPTAYRRAAGYLGVASSGLYPRLKVRHHLDFWARLAYIPKRERTAGIERVVDAFGLAPLLDRRPDRMSMGQRQRVRLAGTFLHAPTLVLLDEAANSLDEEGLELLRAEVERTRERGGSLIWAHPSGEDVHGLEFDSRFALQAGRLVAP